MSKRPRFSVTEGVQLAGEAGSRQKLLQGGEWVDFREKGDACTVFVRLPAFVTLPVVSAVCSRYGALRQVCACGGEPLQDGSWVALIGYYSSVQAMESVAALNGSGGRALWGTPVVSPEKSATLEQYDLFKARLGLKRKGRGVEIGAEDGYLTAQQGIEALNDLMPFQWSNCIDTLELCVSCAPRKEAAPLLPPGYNYLPGKVLGKWDEAEGVFLPLSKDVVFKVKPAAGGGGAAAASSIYDVEGEEEEEGGGALLSKHGAHTVAVDASGTSSDDDPDAPLDVLGQKKQQAKFDDMFRRNPDLCTAEALASAESISTRLGFQSNPLIKLHRPPGPPPTLRLVAAPKGSSSSSSSSTTSQTQPKPPCAFVRQVVFIHNSNGTVVVSCSGGGCTCRHRDEVPLALAFTDTTGSSSGGGGVGVVGGRGGVSGKDYTRPFPAKGQGFISQPPQVQGAVVAPSDLLLPLSQQLEKPPLPLTEASKKARRPRGHLKGRQYTAADILEGLPIKLTASEAFRRACDSLRVWVPKH